MKKGDFVFCNDKLIGKAARSVSLEPGQEWRVHLPNMELPSLDEPFDETKQSTGVFRSIFNLDGIQHWQLSIYGNARPESIFRSGWVVPYESGPSASAAGMVTALDLVLEEVGVDSQTHIGYTLLSMKRYFSEVAKKETKK